MTIEINDSTVQKWIEEEMAAGQYPTAEAMIADAVHALRVERELLPEHHDEATIRRLASNPAALDDESRDSAEFFAELQKLNELRSIQPATVT